VEVPKHHQLNLLLTETLLLCYNRDKADDFSQSFCHYNSKTARKRLIKALLALPRQSLDLLPQYARIIATLDKVHGTPPAFIHRRNP
jgi:regulator of nonsense transcripts 2